ncbi:MAG: SEC-C domain-containing protein [Flavobacteriales bacterium]|nr:SEC-C domain-containing protein [Flavobacteriales bacterium]
MREYISTFLDNPRIEGEIAENDFEDSFFESMAPQIPFVKDKKDVGRNKRCPCGSGKKYKKCCLN